MLCNNPYYKSTSGNITTKHLNFSNSAREALTPFGCGQCLSCRINQARIWTGRLLLENCNSKSSAFITLTYSDDYISHLGPYLQRPELCNYIKRIRKAHEPTKLRYFAIGEYGDQTQRPHYHMALFSNSIINPQDIKDKWEYGYSMIGDISKDSARYIAGYCVKKLTVQNNPSLHALSVISPEFTTQSKQAGGIGLPGIQKLAKQIKKDKFIDKKKILKQLTIGGKIYPLGRYLISKLMDLLGQDHRQLGIEFWDYQQELFITHKHALDKGTGHYLKSIRDEQAQDRLSQQKKHQIYSKKGKI